VVETVDSDESRTSLPYNIVKHVPVNSNEQDATFIGGMYIKRVASFRRPNFLLYSQNLKHHNVMKTTTFTHKEAYELPLRYDAAGDIVFTANNDHAFDFPLDGDENAHTMTEFLMRGIVSKINGGGSLLKLDNLTYDKGAIYHEGKRLMTIRGWGFLTGVSGLRLSNDDAERIQNEFAAFIIQRLSS
jgi:hypothetical protein